MSKWKSRFIELSQLIATWSKDNSTRVGAVIVDADNRVVSLGFNGFPRGVSDNQLSIDRDEKLRRTIHAEENALLFARHSLEGCTIYVTHPPCGRCAAKIIQAGITRVVTPTPPEHFAVRWIDDMSTAADMLKEAGVTLETFTSEGAES